MPEDICDYAIFSRSRLLDSAGISCSAKTKIGFFKREVYESCPHGANSEKCKIYLQ